MERLILGMVHIAEETEIQSLHISQYIPKCHSSPGTLTTWLMGWRGTLFLYEQGKWWSDEVTDKGTQREWHKVLCSIWDEFMVRWIDYRLCYWAGQILNGNGPAEAEFGSASALYNPLKSAFSVCSYLEFLRPRFVPSFPWSVPKHSVSSFNIRHPEN